VALAEARSSVVEDLLAHAEHHVRAGNLARQNRRTVAVSDGDVFPGVEHVQLLLEVARDVRAVGIVAFAILAFFQLVTLPVEFDASRRAKIQLVNLGLVHPEESDGVSKVLNAAALTYVAALINAVLVLLRLILIARDDRD